RLGAQERATEQAAQAICAGKIARPWTIRPVSQGISRLFKIGKRFFPKYYQVTDVCNGCGSCGKVCPAGAITLEGGRPVFSGDCEHCQACFNWCPQRAIQYLRLKPDTPRYHHPEVAFRDMLGDGN
ncbi:MAG: EFR1 family ferrodoxin, partial [Treponema sp.]|nr:EFR1 family ferrodoxin [Treponema sp.]